MAQLYLDEAEVGRDVALLVDAERSLGAVATHAMLSRHSVNRQFEGWSRVQADRWLALDDQARQAVAKAVLDEPLDQQVIERLSGRLSSLGASQQGDDVAASEGEVEWAAPGARLDP